MNRLRVAIDEKALKRPDALASYDANPFQGIFSIAQIGPVGGRIDPVIPELLAWERALDALKMCGIADPRFSSGFSISKPAGAPALFFHRDWHYWESPESQRKFGIQMFLMLYLVDTSRENGCLRVIPGSHMKRIPLDWEHPGEHTRWGQDPEVDQRLPQALAEGVAEHPEAVDVAVKAGDLIIGDSRLYHAARANGSNARRTCITMWYVDWQNCGPGLRQAYGAQGHHGGEPCGIPVSTTGEVAMLEPLHMAYNPSVDGRGEPAVSSRAMGDWGRTETDCRHITTEDTFYFSDAYARAKAHVATARL